MPQNARHPNVEAVLCKEGVAYSCILIIILGKRKALKKNHIHTLQSFGFNFLLFSLQSFKFNSHLFSFLVLFFQCSLHRFPVRTVNADLHEGCLVMYRTRTQSPAKRRTFFRFQLQRRSNGPSGGGICRGSDATGRLPRHTWGEGEEKLAAEFAANKSNRTSPASTNKSRPFGSSSAKHRGPFPKKEGESINREHQQPPLWQSGKLQLLQFTRCFLAVRARRLAQRNVEEPNENGALEMFGGKSREPVERWQTLTPLQEMRCAAQN
eukprot:GHVT01091654.1.p1 GENE.GHVT01091654.1~~GHVT01091654.1.p1  ORF type:complete len:266 (-),score=39.99 GHVT01091654.1:1454-2251(-)